MSVAFNSTASTIRKQLMNAQLNRNKRLESYNPTKLYIKWLQNSALTAQKNFHKLIILYKMMASFFNQT